MIRALFRRDGLRVRMTITEQSERNFKDFMATNGIGVRSSSNPALEHNLIWTRGHYEKMDTCEAVLIFGTESAAELAIGKYVIAIDEFNRQRYGATGTGHTTSTRRTIRARVTGESQLTLTGALCEGPRDHIEFVATNGVKLVYGPDPGVFFSQTGSHWDGIAFGPTTGKTRATSGSVTRYAPWTPDHFHKAIEEFNAKYSPRVWVSEDEIATTAEEKPLFDMPPLRR